MALDLKTAWSEVPFMRAAVVHSVGGDPEVEQFPDPAADEDVADVAAAGLNPVDVAFVAGQMPFRQVSPPFVAGVEGIARLEDGTMRYFTAPKLPYGSLAERVPLAGCETAAVPPGLDPAVAAALGVSGMAAWLSLSSTGGLQQGENVLILGAEGQVGQIATQVARLIGAHVVGAVRREESCSVPMDRGAEAAVSCDDEDTLTERLRAAAPDGFDLILDLVWGPVIGRVLDVARWDARVVQVGNAGGVSASLAAPMLRAKRIRLLPHTNYYFSAEERGAAYQQLAQHAAAGTIRVEVERIPLADAATAWKRLKTGDAPRKLVIVP